MLICALLVLNLAAAEPQIAILGYHDVEAVPHLGWTSSREDFIDQMQLLALIGYHVVPIAEVAEYSSGKRSALAANPVVITVDDGWVTAYTEIRPILRRFEYPWSLFVYPGIISVGAAALKWPQVQELSAAGVDIESHTMTHPHLIRKSHADMSDEQYAAWLHHELADSRRIVEEKTGKPVRFLAYPYGDWDAGVEQEAARDGYTLALTSWQGVSTKRTDPLAMRRALIVSDTTLTQFLQGLGAEPLVLRDALPSEGTVSDSSTIAATIAEASALDPASVHIALLSGEIGDAHFDPDSGRIELKLAANPERAREHVVIWGDRASDSRRMAATWTFYTTPESKTKYDAIRAHLVELPLHRR